MPFPNYHTARQQDPAKYDTCRQDKEKFDKGIIAIFCKKGDGPMELQSLRFPTENFTVSEAKAWLKEHDYRSSPFEEAAGEENAFLLMLATEPAQRAANVRVEQGVPVYRYRKEIMKTGKYVKAADNISFEVTDDTLDHWVATFSHWIANGNKVPIPPSHTKADDDDKNQGWMVDVFKEGNSLIGIIDLYGEDAPRLALTNEISIYVPSEFIDGKGNVYRRPITHAAFCTNPVITGLKGFEAIAASLELSDRKEITMDWTKIKEALGIEEEMTDENAEKLIMAAIAKIKEETEKENEDLKAANEKLKLSLEPKTPDPLLVKLAVDNRGMKLDTLVKAARITPAVKEKLTALYADKKVLTLSLAKGDDGFDELVTILAENDPVKLKEQTGAQALELGNPNADAKNPLLEDAQRRADAAK